MTIYILIALCSVIFLVLSVFVIWLIFNKNGEEIILKKLDLIVRNKIITASITFILVLTFAVIIILAQSEWFNQLILQVSPENGLGQIGDFFNGILTPVISVVSVLFLYRAFKQQHIANELFYNFELERSFNADLEWLRDNFQHITITSNLLEGKEIKELKTILESEKQTDILRVIYYINSFESIFIKLDSELEKRNRQNKNLVSLEKKSWISWISCT